jgi:hypothetical protein
MENVYYKLKLKKSVIDGATRYCIEWEEKGGSAVGTTRIQLGVYK